MPVVDVSPQALERAADLLRAGGVVAFPTETVYGLGACAFDAEAVARIFEIKQRPNFDPLIVHVLGDAMLPRVVLEISPQARALMARFWPGPLTLVLPKQPAVPGIVTAGLASVGVRMPSHPVARELLARVGMPLAAPSANPFGYLSPTSAEHVQRMLGSRVDLILNAGPAEHGLESTIVQPGTPPMLLRRGALPAAEIEAVVGPLFVPASDAAAPASPGRVGRHYAPGTPIRLIDFAAVPEAQRAGAGALAFREAPIGYRSAVVLSAHGDLRQAAARFFELMHQLDAAGLDRIDAEPLPETGLGLALMERLRRATRSA